MALAAPTGKAAARLRQSIDTALQHLQGETEPRLVAARAAVASALARQPARTLHATLGRRPGTRRFVHDSFHLLPVDLLLVDEASMVHGEMLAALLQALPAPARLVLLGDRDQLASVEAGAVMAELCAPGSLLAPQTVTLQVAHRFAGPIAELAARPGPAGLGWRRAGPGRHAQPRAAVAPGRRCQRPWCVCGLAAPAQRRRRGLRILAARAAAGL
jgi:exodeoxyribonuclease V alpha subunit